MLCFGDPDVCHLPLPSGSRFRTGMDQKLRVALSQPQLASPLLHTYSLLE